MVLAHLINWLEFIGREDGARDEVECIWNNRKGKRIRCKFHALFRLIKFQRWWLPQPTGGLAAQATSVDHGGVFSSCVNRFYVGRNRGEYRSLSIPRVTYTHWLFLIWIRYLCTLAVLKRLERGNKRSSQLLFPPFFSKKNIIILVARNRISMKITRFKLDLT